MGLDARKPVFGAPLEIILYKLATSEISIFYLVSGAVQAGLNLTVSESLKTGFVAVID